MARYTLTPVVHHIFNEFDKQGILLDLPRLEEERNVAYKQRLFDVFVNRSDSTHRGLINGITRRLGLKIINCMQIVPRTDDDGNILLPMPAVVFDETKCHLYNDYRTGDILVTFDRWEKSDGCWDLLGLADRINTTGYYTATILEDAVDGDRSMTIFNQSSIGLVPYENLSGKGSRIVLDNSNLIQGSVMVRSPNLTRRVQNEEDLRYNGDYLINLEDGIIYSVATPATGSSIRYQYRDDEFIALASPVILHNLQSDDFKTKMFEQVDAEDSTYSNGRPTPLGADIINELLSVYPTNWGK